MLNILRNFFTKLFFLGGFEPWRNLTERISSRNYSQTHFFLVNLQGYKKNIIMETPSEVVEVRFRNPDRRDVSKRLDRLVTISAFFNGERCKDRYGKPYSDFYLPIFNKMMKNLTQT